MHFFSVPGAARPLYWWQLPSWLPQDGSPGVCLVPLLLVLSPVLSSDSQRNTSHLMSISPPGALQNRHSRVRQPPSLKVLPLECSLPGSLSLQLPLQSLRHMALQADSGTSRGVYMASDLLPWVCSQHWESPWQLTPSVLLLTMQAVTPRWLIYPRRFVSALTPWICWAIPPQQPEKDLQSVRRLLQPWLLWQHTWKK